MSGSTSHGTLASEDDNGNHISVVLRTRPLNIMERHRQETSCLRYPGNGEVEIDWQGVTKYFKYNVVFEETASQQDVFEHSGIKRLVELTLDGYACTSFAYGQTGSGKTHTITGPPSEFFIGKDPNPDVFGIMPRAFIYLYRLIRENKQSTFRVHASYCEIYNEQIVDLLNPNPNNVLALRWHKTRGFYVENLILIECDNLDDLMGVLQTGMKNRAFNSTNPNEYSSRSHSLLTIMVDSENPSLGSMKHGKLTFVDLAGSEKVKDGESLSTEQLQETQNINRSLLVLGNCISALCDSKKKNGHIPYRDSKLTKLLSDSLGGNGVTLMIGCVSPSHTNATETINTLRYSSRAKKIQNKPSVRTDPKEEMIRTLKGEIRMLRQENKSLRESVRSSDSGIVTNNSTGNLPSLTYDYQRPVDQFGYRSAPVAASQSIHGGSNPVQTSWENNNMELPLQSHQPISQPSPPHPRAPVVDNTLYEMLQEYMTENESLRSENSDLQKGKFRDKKHQDNLRRENELLAEELNKIKRRLVDAPHRQQVYNRQRYDYAASPHNGQTRAPPPPPPALPTPQAPLPPSLPPPLPPVRSPRDRLPPPPSKPGHGAPEALVMPTPTPLRGIPSPPPPLGRTHGPASSPRPVERSKIPFGPQEGDRTYATIYVERRRSPPQSPRTSLNAPPHRLSPIQAPTGHPGRQERDFGYDHFDMNKNLRDELSKLDRTIRQHQRVNALNYEIRSMSRK